MYDAEGRICAVQQASSGGGVIGYLYSPDGTRLGEEALSSFSCDVTQNGFLQSGLALTSLSTVDLNGQQVQKVDGNSNLIYMNAFWEGKLLGTFTGTGYSPSNWTYSLNDWVGTKRVVAHSDGSVSTSFVSGPFGDFLAGTGPGGDPSDQHFTGKERDTESGLDYFGARYYGSSMGRFMSPDDGSDQDVSNPQSWNLYSYVRNNPLTNVDPDGHDCIYLNSDNTLNHVLSEDCASDTDAGYYVNGSISTVNENSQGVVTGYSGTSYDTGNLMQGAFASSLPYGPLEGPNNLAGAATIGGWAKPLSIAGEVEFAFLPIGGAEAFPEIELGIGGVGASRAATAASQVARALEPAEQKAVNGVLKQIANGTTKGRLYENVTGLLPPKPAGYYREFTAPLSAQGGRGASRVVVGDGGEVYYTADHYASFTRVK